MQLGNQLWEQRGTQYCSSLVNRLGSSSVPNSSCSIYDSQLTKVLGMAFPNNGAGAPGGPGYPSFAGGTGAPSASMFPPPHTMSLLERTMLQCTTDYYDHYWRGEHDSWEAQDGAGTRAAIYQAMPVPRPRPHPAPYGQPQGPMLNVGEQRTTYSGQPTQANNDRFMDEINQGQYGLVNYTRPAGLELKRVLGKGGQGVACLFEATDPDGSRRRIVVKATNKAEDAALELQNLNVSDFKNSANFASCH